MRRPERKNVASETASATIEMTIVGVTQALELASATGLAAAKIRLLAPTLFLLFLHRLLGHRRVWRLRAQPLPGLPPPSLPEEVRLDEVEQREQAVGELG